MPAKNPGFSARDMIFYPPKGSAMMGSKAFENPLIPHARMRAMFRALVETRILSERAARTRNAIHLVPRGQEACFVGPLIDLQPGDLTSLPRATWLADHIRAIGTRQTAAAATLSEGRKALAAFAAEKSNRTSLAPIDRLLCSVGMAMALKPSPAKSVAVAYAGASDLTAAEWKHFLNVASEGALPLMAVVTPTEKPVDISAVVTRMGLNTIPVIPVDAADAVALYRVAQETLVRARADGGIAVIECIDCGSDPIAILGAQLIKKKICTPRWIAAVEPAFRAALAKL
jgi:TPP-dependent pyruvate/acetoin dehydrogenase alpha subunit